MPSDHKIDKYKKNIKNNYSLDVTTSLTLTFLSIKKFESCTF